MAAATLNAQLTQNSSQQGSTLATAFPQINGYAQNLDLLQIIGLGGSILLNVDYLGAVHNPAVAATNGTRVGQFQTNLSSTATTAQLFASAFANPSQQDVLQVTNLGQNVHYYIDYLGVAHGS